MNKKEKELTAKLLDMASEEFGNHGCNEVGKSFWSGWTTGEVRQFIDEYHQWNGDSDEWNEENYGLDGYIYSLGDSQIMSFLAYKLKNEL